MSFVRDYIVLWVGLGFGLRSPYPKFSIFPVLLYDIKSSFIYKIVQKMRSVYLKRNINSFLNTKL